MPYLDTYRAYCVEYDGTRHEWTGLRRAQAKWRYHWLAKGKNHGKRLKEWGWQRDWQD